MSNGNHNSNGNWSSKLEALDKLPGETVIDKDVSWEKLHERLRGKKISRKIIWYWSAAACLILVLMIPLINSKKKDPVFAKHEVMQNHPGKNSSPATLIDKRSLVEIARPVPFEKNQSIAVAGKAIKKYQVVNPAAVTGKIRLADAVSNADFTKETLNRTLQPLDTSLNLATTLPVKKKLNVVHINELGEPPAETPNITRHFERPSFQKLINQEVYTTSLPPGRNTGFNILKIKNAP